MVKALKKALLVLIQLELETKFAISSFRQNSDSHEISRLELKTLNQKSESFYTVSMFNPVAEDQSFDNAFPPSNQSVRIGEMNGLLFHAGGSSPRPAVLLLHGFPGWERNFDLAHVYRRAGFHTLIVHYRGAWGSSGTFSFSNALKDAQTALEWLRQQPMVNPTRVGLVGHSMGGWIALATAVTEQIPVIAIAPANFGKFAPSLKDITARAAWIAWCEPNITPLKADAELLTDELIAHAAEWNLEVLAPQLDLPIMLFGAERDAVASCTIEFAQQPLLALLPRKANVQNLNTDHSFSTHRIALARETLIFLQKHLETFF